MKWRRNKIAMCITKLRRIIHSIFVLFLSKRFVISGGVYVVLGGLFARRERWIWCATSHQNDTDYYNIIYYIRDEEPTILHPPIVFNDEKWFCFGMHGEYYVMQMAKIVATMEMLFIFCKTWQQKTAHFINEMAKLSSNFHGSDSFSAAEINRGNLFLWVIESVCFCGRKPRFRFNIAYSSGINTIAHTHTRTIFGHSQPN